ncbi:SDR family NAD(P)-dependent oxidoreductase [SAR92 clade bacterium H246]
MTPNELLSLQHKTVIVTGAATGLGAATAKLLSAAGAHIVINHMPGQESLASQVAEACPGETICIAADITDDQQCRSLAQAAMDQWGSIDILVNNAGINKPVNHHDLDGLSGEDFLNIYNVNVVGAFQMIRAVAPAMKTRGKGVVINISSGSGENGNGSSIAYSASKGAINTVTKSLGRALAPEIRVNAVCPGFIDTEIWQKLNLSAEEREEMRQANIAETPLQLEAKPELIARSILFLASELSAHLTGQLIASDGGMLLGVYQPWFEDFA